mmetsp:Transcript_4749/g.8126  ORF Transcript_4749/g.8126 Transcript_4749/m.8126 type:complete len:159 (-) Transcript_4749:84-560(-)
MWDVESVRFHYPAEHLFNSTAYDLEMQIFHKDTHKRCLACSSKQAALSVFFSLDKGTLPTGSFFDFQEKEEQLDISQLLKVDAAMDSYISGYIGTDTMPDCSLRLCWYVYEEPFLLTQSQLDFFKAKSPDVPHNAREANAAPLTSYKKLYYSRGFYKD